MATGNSNDCCGGCTSSGAPCPPDTTTTPPAVPPCTPFEYTCGDWLVKHDANGCVTRERVANNMPNGTYVNPTITVSNGCITAIAAGGRVLQSRPEPCTTSTPNITPPAAVGLDPNICNQLSGSASALLANCVVTSGANMTVTGCGTANNPYVLNYSGPLPTAGYSPTFVNGVAVQTPLITPVTQITSATLAVNTTGGTATLNTTGVDFNSGGIQIAAGLVKNWTQPIMAVTGAGPISVTMTGASAAISLNEDAAILQEKIVAGVTCGGAFINPETGTPPPLGAWDVGTFRVYDTRVFTGLPYAITVYNSSGIPIGTGAGFISTASVAAARSLLASAYAFAGNGAC